jgi:hypothetical protein
MEFFRGIMIGAPIALAMWTIIFWLATFAFSHAQTRVTSADLGPRWVSSATGAAHGSGQSVGGLLAIPVGFGNTTPTNNPIPYGWSGIITQFAWKSAGGSTVQLLIRLWSRRPSATTCTDGVNFAANANDDLYLITPPFSITPAAPAITTGDSSTYSSVTGLTYDWMNRDQPQTINLYACAIATATDSSDNSTTVFAMASGPQNP